MAEAQALSERLLASQNPDGGWPFRKGTSWAEPTAFAALALQSLKAPANQEALDKAVKWLLDNQKPSGGWSPNSKVQECTSVTSLVTLALLPFITTGKSDHLDAALRWITGQVYRADFSIDLFIARLLHLPPAHAPGSVPWYPGTAGWVTPTALSALVLMRSARETNKPHLYTLAHQSCLYLSSRRCADHGWNHGGSKNRSEDATSYPETTGLALLALRAASFELPPQSVKLARQFIQAPASTEGLAWLQLALTNQDQPTPDPPDLPSPRTTCDVALRLLSLAAVQGKNLFLSA